jgi:hypothetical protein
LDGDTIFSFLTEIAVASINIWKIFSFFGFIKSKQRNDLGHENQRFFSFPQDMNIFENEGDYESRELFHAFFPYHNTVLKSILLGKPWDTEPGNPSWSSCHHPLVLWGQDRQNFSQICFLINDQTREQWKLTEITNHLKNIHKQKISWSDLCAKIILLNLLQFYKWDNKVQRD